MKKLALVVLFVCSAAFAQSPTKQPIIEQPSAQNARQESSDPKTSPPQGPIIINVVPAQKTDAERAEETKDRREKAETDAKLTAYTGDLADFTRGLFYATVVLGGATIGLLVFGWLQRGDMKASIAASTAAVEVANRAYIAEHRTWLKVYPIEIGPLVVENGKFRISITIEAQNVGNNPAVAIRLGCQPYQGRGYAANQTESTKLVERNVQFASIGGGGLDLLPGEKTSTRFIADAEISPRLEDAARQQLEAGVPEQNMPLTISAAYCVIYKQVASDTWSYSSHVLSINRIDGAGFETVVDALPVGSLKSTVIGGESRFG